MVTKLIQAICVLSVMFCVSCSSASDQNTVETHGRASLPNRIDSILDKLNERTRELQSYQCQIEYKYVQPSVFDAQTIRRGILYYLKSNESGKSLSKLRVNFQTLQQDEDEEQKYNEQYIIVDGTSIPDSGGKYKGLWLVQLDYELKNCKYIQLTLNQSGSGLTQADSSNDEPNKPVDEPGHPSRDVFELISTKLPIVGFSKTDRLKEEFEISLVTQNDPVETHGRASLQLQFKVKPNSVYKDDYVQIDCVIDEKQNLPVEIKAISTEPTGETLENKDLYEIKFTNTQINEKIDEKVFDFEIPKDFGKPDVYPLEN